MIDRITSRAVIGRFYRTLEQDAGIGWVDPVSMYFRSDQESEEYAWLGQTPAMREWVGGRHAKGFNENKILVKNKHFEATLEVPVRHMRRDKSGQVMTRIDELAMRANAHWATLLSTLIIGGESTVCYDGQFFFDTVHEEGDSGSQSNDISADISGYPTGIHGTPAKPSVAEMQHAIMDGLQQLARVRDDQGEPMNETARRFVVITPSSLYTIASQAIKTPSGTTLEQLGLPEDYEVSVAQNVRLDTWTDKFAIFRTDGRVKPFIRQEEDGLSLKAKAEGSDFEFDNDVHQYVVDTWREVAYGYWQHACLVNLI